MLPRAATMLLISSAVSRVLLWVAVRSWASAAARVALTSAVQRAMSAGSVPASRAGQSLVAVGEDSFGFDGAGGLVVVRLVVLGVDHGLDGVGQRGGREGA
jgi:hypothetical protein